MISQYTIVSILAEYGIKGKFKIGSPTLLYEIITLGLCFNVWLWATIKQRLPKQECGDQVRMYIIFSVNPIGWMRILALILSCIYLLVMALYIYS